MKRSTSFYLDQPTRDAAARLAAAHGISQTAVVTLGVRLADRVLADPSLSAALRDVLEAMREGGRGRG